MSQDSWATVRYHTHPTLRHCIFKCPVSYSTLKWLRVSLWKSMISMSGCFQSHEWKQENPRLPFLHTRDVISNVQSDSWYSLSPTYIITPIWPQYTWYFMISLNSTWSFLWSQHLYIAWFPKMSSVQNSYNLQLYRLIGSFLISWLQSPYTGLMRDFYCSNPHIGKFFIPCIHKQGPQLVKWVPTPRRLPLHRFEANSSGELAPRS